uniref:Putative prophage protein (Ps3) n=1 Tax=Methanococcus maripaludis (strain C6 / ATCC BAA-1332) TaxID=444158 RepID=A9A748_METM6
MDNNCTIQIFDVAKWFLNKESMSHKKLQKLCYYALSWYSAVYDKELIPTVEFEAWVHGPVIRELYENYKSYKFFDIPKETEKPDFSKELNNFLDSIYETYGEMSGDELESLTHQEEPWINARMGLKDYESSKNIINNEIIKKFYRNMMEKITN